MFDSEFIRYLQARAVVKSLQTIGDVVCGLEEPTSHANRLFDDAIRAVESAERRWDYATAAEEVHAIQRELAGRLSKKVVDALELQAGILLHLSQHQLADR